MAAQGPCWAQLGWFVRRWDQQFQQRGHREQRGLFEGWAQRGEGRRTQIQSFHPGKGEVCVELGCSCSHLPSTPGTPPGMEASCDFREQ